MGKSPNRDLGGKTLKTFRLGIIGLGDMANIHLKELSSLAAFRITAICDVNPERLESAGSRLGIPHGKRYADYTDLIRDGDVDAVVSITPNHLHADIMRTCLEAGKPFMSEKPFTRTFEEAEELLGLYLSRPVPAMIGFSYRYTPAFRLARKLIQSGKIGRVRTFSMQYLQGWGAAVYRQPYVWRFDKSVAGSGTLGDLGSHMIDMAHFLFGRFQELSSQMATLIPERQTAGTGEFAKVEVDDFVSFQAFMQNGAAGIFQTTRNAIGSENQLEVFVYGDAGTLRASTVNPGHLIWIHVDEETGLTVEKKLTVPPGARLTQWEDFAGLLAGVPDEGLPDFMAGYDNQRVIEAVIRSNEWKRTVTVSYS